MLQLYCMFLQQIVFGDVTALLLVFTTDSVRRLIKIPAVHGRWITFLKILLFKFQEKAFEQKSILLSREGVYISTF